MRIAPHLFMAVTVLLGPVGLAQDKIAPAPAPAEPRVSINFPGGTLRQFVDQLRQKDPALNIVVAELAQEVTLPALTLSDAGVSNALHSVAEIAPANFMVRAEARPGQIAPVYTVLVQRAPAAPAPHKEVRVFSLRKLIEPMPGDSKDQPIAIKPATILTAIESGAQGMIEPPLMRFHADSGLLFVHGEPERIELVRQVLTNIENDQQLRRALTRGPGATAPVERGKDAAAKDGK